MNDKQLRSEIEQVLYEYCHADYPLSKAIKSLITIAKDYKRKKEK